MDYGFEHLQNALSLLHKAGNRKILNEKTGKEYGVPELHLRMYADRMKKLYDAASDYEEAVFAVPRDNVLVAERVGPIRAAWAEMLKCSADTIVEVEPCECDLTTIASYASKFTNSDANFDLVEHWENPKTTAPTTPAAFQKSVETYIGIRVDKTVRLTATQRDYIEDSNSVASNIRSKSKNVEKMVKEISELKAEIEARSELAVKAYLGEILKKKETELEGTRKIIEELKKSLEEMRGLTPEAYVAMKAEREKAEVQRRRSEREKARAEKKKKAEAQPDTVASATTEESTPESKPAKSKGKGKSGKKPMKATTEESEATAE